MLLQRKHTTYENENNTHGKNAQKVGYHLNIKTRTKKTRDKITTLHT